MMGRIKAAWRNEQHRNTVYLLLNSVTGAAAGLLFWLLLARAARLDAAAIGFGYTVVAVGTTVGVLAKGGLDTALLRHVPGASRSESGRLLRESILLSAGISLALAFVAATMGPSTPLAALPRSAWLLAGAIGALMAATWLQDAYFLAEGDARFSFHRNLVLSAARLLLPIPVVLLAIPQPVAVSWGLALAASALAALAFGRRLRPRTGAAVGRRAFLRSAARNVTGSAAEFLPGLLLAPIVLATAGHASAAYFGMAWTAASLLFLASAAASRSALAQLVRTGDTRATLRHAVRQHAALVWPATLGLLLVGPPALAIFGPGYAAGGGPALVLLAASMLAVAPTYLYLAYLRATDHAATLVLFPLAMVAALLAAAPVLGSRWGTTGVAAAWLLANLPFGAWAAFRLSRLAAGTSFPAPRPNLSAAKDAFASSALSPTNPR